MNEPDMTAVEKLLKAVGREKTVSGGWYRSFKHLTVLPRHLKSGLRFPSFFWQLSGTVTLLESSNDGYDAKFRN